MMNLILLNIALLEGTAKDLGKRLGRAYSTLGKEMESSRLPMMLAPESGEPATHLAMYKYNEHMLSL
jgi:hypothetical protein